MQKQLLLLSLCGLLALSTAQQLPYIACPQYFKYLAFNGQFIGHLSLYHDPIYEVNNVVVEFSQRGAYDWSYVGSLTLWDDQETIKANLRNGDPINYRVDFPIPDAPPKLTQIKLNSQVLCSAALYGRPRTAIALMHTLRSTVTPLTFAPQNQPSFQFQPAAQDFFNNTGPIFNNEPAFTTQRTIPQFVPQPVRPQPQPRPAAQPEVSNSVEQKIAVPVSQICGRERAVSTPLIFQGQTLARGQLPWLVGLFERTQAVSLNFFCGGTLLSSSTVISAAHCFRFTGRNVQASSTVVSLGRNTIDVFSEGELRDVTQLLINDRYNEAEFTEADLALLRLATPVTFNDYIVPICLWSESFPLQLPSGYKAYVAGWGADGNGNVNTQLSKIADVNIVSEPNCLRELPGRLVQPSAICAKKSGTGPCASDGGGGLMLRENNVWLLRAIISTGLVKENTCDLTKPAVYTDVAKHIAWVRQNMWE
ncbi:hypothetical protein KR093_003860 [Drosophila rubida]|uniref:Peptidase S1 domain-containing protein n=1 Tax=Drosophila rubida TaxID=30044 RepID=A0AAD4KDT1_9MUSC|nr:hypothetical protein KR093_003860 [Drosophila rubida]